MSSGDGSNAQARPAERLGLSVEHCSVAILASAMLFIVECAYVALYHPPSVEVTLGLWAKLLLSSVAFIGLLAAPVALALAVVDRLVQSLEATWLGRARPLAGGLQAALLSVLLPALLLSTQAELSLLQKTLSVLAGPAIGFGFLLLRWILQRAGASTAREIAHENVTGVLALGFVLWFLAEIKLWEGLQLAKFGVDTAMRRKGTLMVSAVPIAVMLLYPAMRAARSVMARQRWLKLPAILSSLAALALLHHGNTVLFTDNYHPYHRVLSLLACVVAVWLATQWLGSHLRARGTLSTTNAVAALLAVCTLPVPTLWQAHGPAAYVAAVHTVWLRLGYDATGPLRRVVSEPGIRPAEASIPIALGPQTVPYERMPRDVVVFMLDAQRADDYSLHGEQAAHIPHTVRCFDGAFELRRSFTAGTATELAFPAFHTSTHGVSRDQWRGEGLASEAWLAGANATTLTGAMSSAGYKTVLISDPWYLDAFFNLPRWTPVFGRFDEIVGVEGGVTLEPGWGSALETAQDEKLLVIVHIFDHGLVARPKIDARIGTICEELERRGRLASSVLLLTADHGMQLREHGRETYGRTLFNEEARVPTFIRVPGLRGEPRDFNLSFVDHLPTLLDLQGIPIPPSAEGQSYLPLLLGGTPNRERPIFMETRMTTWGSSAVLRGDLKLIRWHTPHVEAMFDLARDPDERRNVADAADLHREAAELRGWLDAFLAR